VVSDSSLCDSDITLVVQRLADLIVGNVGHGGTVIASRLHLGKSLDDVSGIIGGTGSTGAVTLFSPQNPSIHERKEGRQALT